MGRTTATAEAVKKAKGKGPKPAAKPPREPIVWEDVYLAHGGKYTVKKIIVVTGSRRWANPMEIDRLLAATRAKYPDALLFVGDARGADRMAFESWKARDGHGRLFKAHWDAEGKAAGFKRNERMLDAALAAADVSQIIVLAFLQDRDSVGTLHCIASARKRAMQVLTVNP